MASISTIRILLDKALQETAGHNCVDWAIGMLERGRDGHHLLRLAGMLPLYNHFEIADLRDRALEELGIEDLAPDDAVRSYAVELLESALAGKVDLVRAFETLAGLYVANGYQRDILDFYLLHYAHKDLQEDDIQWYWDGASRNNIDAVMRDQAEQFLAAQAKTVRRYE